MSLQVGRKASWLLVVLAATLLAQQKKPLTNQDVVTMVKNGFSESVILMAIRANSCEFDTSADALIALKNQGVSDAIIREVLAQETRKRGRASNMADRTPSAGSRVPSNMPGSGFTSSAATRHNPSSGFPTFPVDFAAERFLVQGSQAPASDGTIVVSKGRLRYAPAAPGAITIVDPVSRMAYLVSPGQAAEVVRRFEGVRGVVNQGGLSKFLLPVDPENPCAFWLDVECKNLGSESTGGRSTTKWEVTHTPAGTTWTTYMWVDTKLHIVSRIQFGENVTELRNIAEGAQSVVFEVP
jgi:hypothetical protein